MYRTNQATAEGALPGRRLGDFIVRDQIARGSFADVFLATQPALHREAAVKILRPEAARHPGFVARFRQEALIAAHIDHPYAVHLYGFGIEPDGTQWLAMELVRGTPLNRLLQERGAIELQVLAPLVGRIAAVLDTLHEQGIVHRDVKPANLLVLTRAGELLPKLIDFGVAARIDLAPIERLAVLPVHGTTDSVTLDLRERGPDGPRRPRTPTMDDAIVGSPPYMAPELWRSGSVGPSVDQYALALVAYEALAGQRPFASETIPLMATLHRDAPLPPIGRGVSPSVDRVLARGAAKRPRDRYPSVMAFAQDLEVAALTTSRSSA